MSETLKQAHDRRAEIFKEIEAERDYQDKRWGGPGVDDEKNKPNDWVSYIAKYSTRWQDGTFFPYIPETEDEFRKCMVKVAALAVAAIEQVDRQRGK